MAQFGWVADAPTGVYKNHALSADLRFASSESTVFNEHVRAEPGYGRKAGESVTITRVSQLTEPTSASLTEGVRIPEDAHTLNTTQIYVEELGRAVPFTSLSEDLSSYDITNSIQRMLVDQLAKVLDTLAAAAFTGCQVKYIPTGASAGSFDTDGTASTTATANMNFYHLEEIRDYMVSTLHTPMIGDSYFAIGSVKSLRGLKRDPAYETWQQYTNPGAKMNSEVGRIEQVRFQETNHANALSNGVGTGSVLGEMVIFGDDAVAMVEAMPPELRAAIPQDFGRQNSVAWYGVLGYDEVFPTANAGEARVVHITSA